MDLSAFRPTTAVVLGSGLNDSLAAFPVLAELPYSEVEGMPEPTVPGHAGCFRILDCHGTTVLAAVGRTHVYEGRGMHAVTAAIRQIAALGVKSVLLTNAAGGIRDDLAPGCLMRITDHINLMGASPLEGGPAFQDMSQAYDPALAQAVEKAAAASGVPLASGVYAAVRGPQYETPAEVRMLATLGADAVGMSTVPETIMARSLGLRVAGLSLISNRASGLGHATLDHHDVVATGKAAASQVAALLANLLPRIGDST